MAGAASQAGDADSSRAPGLNSGLQGSVNVPRGTLFQYGVGLHPVSSLHIHTFVVSRAFMAGAASQAGDADSSRAPGLNSGLQGSVNVPRGTLLLVPQ